MKQSDIRRSFNDICEFKNINNLRGLAYCIFDPADDRVSIPYFDEIFGGVIKLFSKLELANNIQFVLSEEYLNLRDKVEIEYYTAEDMGVTTEMELEGHIYETVTVILQKILDEITSRTVQGVIDVTSPYERWSTERFANLSGCLKPNSKYIASPKIAAALKCIHHNVEIKGEDQIFSPFYHNNSLVFIDMFASEDFLMEFPNKIIVSLSPEIKLKVRDRKDFIDPFVVKGTIALEVGFEPVGLINKIVGLGLGETIAEVPKD
jgi:hypothetical protein